MDDQEEQRLIAVWDAFNQWLIAPDVVAEQTSNIAPSLLFSLYHPMITTKIFWNRCEEVIAAYRVLPDSLDTIAHELYRLGLSSAYRLPHVDISSPAAAAFHRGVLQRVGWHRETEHYNNEVQSIEVLLGMVQLWHDVSLQDAAVDGRVLLITVELWQRMQLAVDAHDAKLVIPRQYKIYLSNTANTR